MTDEPADTSVPLDPFTLEGIIAQEPVKPVWYKRAWVLATGAVVAVVVASVLVDLPSKTTVATDTADQTAVMKQINSAIAGCSFGVAETFTIYQALKKHSLSASNKAETPSMLRDDQSACSFTSSSIFDLSNVQGTGTAAGKNIGQVVNVATLWATSDALGAIEDIQTLTTSPGNATALADLSKRQVALAQGRTQARNYVLAADRILNTRLPMPDMPALPHLIGT
ncbi:MAG TPA: hypothetical protein VF320_03905 [Acidimicrobiales bacterium]